MPLQEQTDFLPEALVKQNTSLCAISRAAIQLDLTRIEMAIKQMVAHDKEIRNIMEIITSVPGVGKVTALQIIITTNETKRIRNPKQFACYAGVAPFKKESGTVSRRSRVSTMANKRMKGLLHICALSAITHSPDLKAYYLRKTIIEGKPKMAVINAVRYKLILRIFACINQSRCYEKNHQWQKISQSEDAQIVL
jgi:transposase